MLTYTNVIHDVAGSVEELMAMIDVGADINLRNDKGQSVLHLLCRQLIPITCWQLLEIERAPGDYTYSSYDASDRRKYLNIMAKVELLLASDADVKGADLNGDTVLHEACRTSSV